MDSIKVIIKKALQSKIFLIRIAAMVIILLLIELHGNTIININDFSLDIEDFSARGVLKYMKENFEKKPYLHASKTTFNKDISNFLITGSWNILTVYDRIEGINNEIIDPSKITFMDKTWDVDMSYNILKYGNTIKIFRGPEIISWGDIIKISRSTKIMGTTGELSIYKNESRSVFIGDLKPTKLWYNERCGLEDICVMASWEMFYGNGGADEQPFSQNEFEITMDDIYGVKTFNFEISKKNSITEEDIQTYKNGASMNCFLYANGKIKVLIKDGTDIIEIVSGDETIVNQIYIYQTSFGENNKQDAQITTRNNLTHPDKFILNFMLALMELYHEGFITVNEMFKGFINNIVSGKIYDKNVYSPMLKKEISVSEIGDNSVCSYLTQISSGSGEGRKKIEIKFSEKGEWKSNDSDVNCSKKNEQYVGFEGKISENMEETDNVKNIIEQLLKLKYLYLMDKESETNVISMRDLIAAKEFIMRIDVANNMSTDLRSKLSSSGYVSVDEKGSTECFTSEKISGGIGVMGISGETQIDGWGEVTEIGSNDTNCKNINSEMKIVREFNKGEEEQKQKNIITSLQEYWNEYKNETITEEKFKEKKDLLLLSENITVDTSMAAEIERRGGVLSSGCDYSDSFNAGSNRGFIDEKTKLIFKTQEGAKNQFKDDECNIEIPSGMDVSISGGGI